MQQIPVGSGFQGSQAQGSGSSQSLRSGGDPPQTTRASCGRPKKRDRCEPACDPAKQQRVDKSRRCVDERDGAWKPDSLVGKDGGLCSVASVDRLVCIMQYDWNDTAQRPVDLIVSRTMLAKVVATTVELDCLCRFLKLGGLSILDRWLQEAHRGRPLANKGALEDGEKALEDLLLALLAALERLPVDLVALKTCSVGKSVNYLRSHKHPDIQRRARKLVDTWKKRVESEMKQSGEGRVSIDPGLCLQPQDVGMSALMAQDASYPEHPAHIEYSCLGRGKFASVASLCSSPESQSKASSTILPFSPASACSVDTSNEALLATNVPAKPSNVIHKQAHESTLHPSDAYTQSDEDGRAISTMDLTQNNACGYKMGEPCNQARAIKSTGASGHRQSNNVSNSIASSVATTLSGSVIVSKDQIACTSVSGSRQPHGVSVPSGAEVCTLPCCSPCQKNPDTSLIYDALSRSTLNSASSCVADYKGRTTFSTKYRQPHLAPERAKAGIQLLASIAASESSMIDVKRPDSPSERSVSMRRATTLPNENSILPEVGMKCCNEPSSKLYGRLQDREHNDRNSSTVSSPSETSTHVDIRMCESGRAPAAYLNAPSSVDTTSETSLPSLEGKDAGRNSGACTSGSLKEHGKVQALSEKSKRFCVQSVSVAEAVGESSVVDRAESKMTAIFPSGIVLENTAKVQGLKERSPSLRCTEDDSLEIARQVAVEVEREVVDGRGRSDIFERISSHTGDTVDVSRFTHSSAIVNSKQDPSRIVLPVLEATFSAAYGETSNAPLRANACSAVAGFNTPEQKQRTLGSEVIASTRREETERPVFDLNEMLSGEEGPVQACTTSGHIPNGWGPFQDCSFSTSVSKPSLPIVPMAPIAVVAAVKGSFTLPAVSFRPIGELGWRGSAATSAFRPTQPRRSLEKNSFTVPKQSPHVKTLLDFDLNITADSSSIDDDKVGNGMGLASTFLVAKVAAKQGSSPASAGLVIPKKACESHRVAWDLNQVDEGAAESYRRPDFDLNSGPMLQDIDDVVLSGKHIRMLDPMTSATTNTGIANRLPRHPVSPTAPFMISTFAMPNSDVPYPGGSAIPWVNSGPHDGLLQYNIFMQNQNGFPSSGIACPPLASMASGPYGGMPVGFSSASMQGFSAPFMDALRAPPLAAVSPPFASNEPLMPSQIKPPYMMGVLADASYQQGGFWSRPRLDLNAGPEGVDANNAKNDKRHLFVLNEQMRARHQVMDLAALLQQREQEGCVGMSASMQGALSKHPAWR